MWICLSKNALAQKPNSCHSSVALSYQTDSSYLHYAYDNAWAHMWKNILCHGVLACSWMRLNVKTRSISTGYHYDMNPFLFCCNQKSCFKSFKLRKNCSEVVYPGQASRWKGCFKNGCFFPQLSVAGRISSFFRSLSVLRLGSRADTQEERRVLFTNSKDFLLNILYTASYCCPKYCSNIFKKG